MRRRLGRLVVEVVSVVFAVLVALAADEWRENRQLDARAAEVRASVMTELAANRNELISVGASMDSLAVRLASAVAAMDQGSNASVGVNLELPDFSDAAWRLAQMTDAARRLEIPWLIQVGRIYSSQGLFDETRTELIRTMGVLGGEESERALRRLRDQLGILLQFRTQLLEEYGEVLD